MNLRRILLEQVWFYLSVLRERWRALYPDRSVRSLVESRSSGRFRLV